MEKEITVRFITDKDYPSLFEIENSVWTNENSPVIHHYNSVEEYKEIVADRFIFVATDNERVLGFLDVHHPTPLISHQKQWMLAIAVDKTNQSQGIGKKLLDYIKKLAIEEGIHKLSLRVMASNTAAIQFYKKNGFIQEGHFKDEFFINGSFCDDYQLAYFIAKS